MPDTVACVRRHSQHGMYIQLQFALVHYLAVRLTTVMNEGACYCASPVLWSFVH